MNIRLKFYLSPLLLCFFLVIIGCEKPEPVAEKIYRPVQYIQIKPASGEFTQTFSGIIEAGVDADLSFRVGGTLKTRHVKLGESVDEGQLLAELDNTDYQVAVQQARANYKQAQANQRNLQANYDRVTELYENNNASKADLDAARAGAESARAATDVARNQLASAELQLSYTQLKSPQACHIAAFLVEKNEAVRAGQNVARVNCGRCPKVSISIPEQFIQAVQSGDEVFVMTSTDRDQRYPAIITEVGFAAINAGTFPVEAHLKGECPDLRSGMTATVEFDFSKQFAREDSQLIVPYLSVGEDNTGHFVYVLEQTRDNIFRVTRRDVKIGYKALNGLQIIEGLEPGEKIATAGVRHLSDGMEVKLLEKPILGVY